MCVIECMMVECMLGCGNEYNNCEKYDTGASMILSRGMMGNKKFMCLYVYV